jgi:hypothetical protein
MIVLNKFGGQAKQFELVCPECLREKAPAVLENVGYDYNNILQVPRFDFNLHIPLPFSIIPGLNRTDCASPWHL